MEDHFDFRSCFIVVVNDNQQKNDPLCLEMRSEYAKALELTDSDRCFVVCLQWTSQVGRGGLPLHWKQLATVRIVETDGPRTEKCVRDVSCVHSPVVLYASPFFVEHYRLDSVSISDGFKMKMVKRPVQLTRATLCAHTEHAYERLKGQWTTDLLIRVCDQRPVLLRRGDVFALDPSSPYDLTVLDCDPVEQGVLTTSTALTVVRASTLFGPPVPPLSCPAPRIESLTVNYSHYRAMLSFLAVVLASYWPTKKKSSSVNSFALLSLSYRLLNSWKMRFFIQILPKAPFRVGSRLETELDPFGVVFVSSAVLRYHGLPNFTWVLLTLSTNSGGTKRSRFARLCSIEQLASELNLSAFGVFRDGVCYLTPLLWFNLNEQPSKLIQPDATLECSVIPPNDGRFQSALTTFSFRFASEIHVCLVQSPEYSSFVDCDSSLQDYFKVPRLMCEGDVFCFPSKQPVSSSQFQSEELKNRKPYLIYFRVSKIESGSSGHDRGLLVDRLHSSLFRAGTFQTYVPVTMENYWSSDEMHPIWDSPVPFPYHGSCEKLVSSVFTYFKSPSLKKIAASNTVCLVGPRGSGKRVLLSALAKQLNLKVCAVSCWELMGESAGATASRIQTVIQKVASYAPCLLILKNVHLIGTDGSGIADGESRIVYSFKEALLQLNQICFDHPVVVVGTTTKSDLLCPDLASLFLHYIEIEEFGSRCRAEMLRALMMNFNVGLNVSLEGLTQQTNGFLLDDLCALVSYAKISAHRRINKMNGLGSALFSLEDESDLCLAGLKLLDCDFEESFALLQTSLSDSIGAPKIPNVKWEDVGGLEDAKAEILDTVQLPLQHPELLSSGLRRSGVLLYGPPGTGKTLIAKAVATECSLNFLSVKGPELINMYVGQSEENVRKIFEMARSASPCIIFFDELDSLAPNRGKSGDSGGVMDRVVSQLLSEMDGLHHAKDVFVMGATNRPDLLDPALLRPRRFDKLVYVGISSDKPSQLKILRALTRKFSFTDSFDLDEIVAECPPNLTGADFYALCSDAHLNAMSRIIHLMESSGSVSVCGDEDCCLVTKEDFLEALNNLTPSVSKEQLEHYSNIQQKMKR